MVAWNAYIRCKLNWYNRILRNHWIPIMFLIIWYGQYQYAFSCRLHLHCPTIKKVMLLLLLPLLLIQLNHVSTWWRHQVKTFSALLVICAGNSPATDEFPAQNPVTRSFDVFFDLRLNIRLSKQSWCWWFETPSAHYDVIVIKGGPDIKKNT